MTKSELRQVIREVLHEELASKKYLKEAQGADSDRSFKNKLMKAFINNGDRKVAEYLHKHEFYSTDKIAKSTAEISSSGTISIHIDLCDVGQIDSAMKAVKKAMLAGGAITEALNISTGLDWQDLLVAADNLLNKLIAASGNADYDDGDGYWSGEEGYEWCNRYLYYSDTLNNTSKLDRLCASYSSKLPNVEFYYSEDLGVSEIGYVATRNED
jgi:hypothetical protein